MIDNLIDFAFQFFKIENEVLARSVVNMVLKFFAPLMFLIAFYKMVMIYIYRILARKRLANNKKFRIVFWIRIGLRIFFVSLFFIIVRILTGENLVDYLRVLFSVVNQPFFVSGNNSISILTLIMIIPIYYLSTWVGKITYKVFDASSFTSSNVKQSDVNNVYLGNLNMFVKPGTSKTIAAAKVLKYCIIVFVFIIGLSLIGINLSSIAVLLGVLGIGLGFGLQNLVANIFAGFVIMLTKVIKEGDFINVKGDRGTVTKINSVSSIVTTRLNETIIVPNSVLISDVIYNESYEDRSVVIENSVVVSYDSDIDFVRSLLIDIAKRSPYSKKHDEPDPRILKFDRAGIEMVLLSTINEVVERGPARAWLNLEIWREFKKNNITIPVSQMDVNVKAEEEKL
ncbi:MAG: mechanosensitive ion channel [Spirochaetaceae bacterium]|nr:mechanosensitive ion channel [Spirochaetaceae bacterium]